MRVFFPVVLPWQRFKFTQILNIVLMMSICERCSSAIDLHFIILADMTFV